MSLTGREHELATVRRALAEGRSVVVRGPFGIGRTSLLRALAAEAGPGWRFLFVSLGETPKAVCLRVLEGLVAPRRGRAAAPGGYREVRRRISQGRLASGTSVLVLDDIGRLTTAKWELLRFLAAVPALRVVAIAESFLPGPDVTRLRAVLYPSVWVELGHLSLDASVRYFTEASERHGLGWSDEHVRMLATSRGGYPLEMVEAVARARRSLARRTSAAAEERP